MVTTLDCGPGSSLHSIRVLHWVPVMSNMSDRLMVVRLIVERTVLNLISTNISQDMQVYAGENGSGGGHHLESNTIKKKYF